MRQLWKMAWTRWKEKAICQQSHCLAIQASWNRQESVTGVLVQTSRMQSRSISWTKEFPTSHTCMECMVYVQQVIPYILTKEDHGDTEQSDICSAQSPMGQGPIGYSSLKRGSSMYPTMLDMFMYADCNITEHD